MWRELYMLLVLGGVLTLLRLVLLSVMEVRQRYSVARQFRDEQPQAQEAKVQEWRVKTSRALWINLVGIPLFVFMVILAIAHYS